MPPPPKGGNSRVPAFSKNARSGSAVARARPDVPVTAAPSATDGGGVLTPGTALEIVGTDLRQIRPGALDVGQEIGKGRFKKVLCGQLRKAGSDRKEVVDVVILRFTRNTDVEEIQILMLLARCEIGNAFVPEILGVSNERGSTSLVQERAGWGSLRDGLKDPDVVPLITSQHRLCAGAQLASAMMFLQTKGIVHADLACRNVLVFRLDENPAQLIVKIADFGLALVLKEGADCELRQQPRATRWCSPENVAHGKLSHRSDIWSLGATLWECFSSGEVPWTSLIRRSDVSKKLETLATGCHDLVGDADSDVAAYFDFPDTCTNEVAEAILSCLRVDEFRRPTFAQLLHVFDRMLNGEWRNPKAPLCGMNFEGIATRSSQGTGDHVFKQTHAEDESQADAHVPPPPAAPPPLMAASMHNQTGRVAAISHNLTTSIAAETPQSLVPKPFVPASTTTESVSSRRSVGDRRTLPHSVGTQEELSCSPRQDDNFKALVDFLYSQRAREILGYEAVLTMRREIDDAKRRERRLSHAAAVVTKHTPSVTSSSAGCLTAPTTLPSLSPRHGDHGGLQAATRGTAFSSTTASATVLGTTALSGWSLWSFVTGGLKMIHFAREAEAWDAFHEHSSAVPCVLRDQAGTVIAAKSWVTGAARVLPPVVTNLTAAASPSGWPIPLLSREASRSASPTPVLGWANSPPLERSCSPLRRRSVTRASSPVLTLAMSPVISRASSPQLGQTGSSHQCRNAVAALQWTPTSLPVGTTPVLNGISSPRAFTPQSMRPPQARGRNNLESRPTSRGPSVRSWSPMPSRTRLMPCSTPLGATLTSKTSPLPMCCGGGGFGVTSSVQPPPPVQTTASASDAWHRAMSALSGAHAATVWH
eukprot:TRINITY_DN19103_c1_g2_i1.p1 TRINITY_DN19103_c1_g2~~TRINITY_DN19103_c1_g2_i1.p1  ORF type:complete len:885 (+),score=122.88 TRINITY_DN19103_c1_g2_i1:30-2657(+)